MISYKKFELDNGLKVIHHHDPDSTVVLLNILYNVGARDENESRTGFAHLFEHLMFGGSINVPKYDKWVENAGGSNNAFTNNDYTNYYITVPFENAETAFWLESDRMLQLDFSQKSLDVQKGVVIEEFKQRCFNAPFGQLWHHVRQMVYTQHPYKWPTIGLELSHIENATLEDVKAFYEQWYTPANAILCVAGNISEEKTLELSNKWFGSINKEGRRNPNLYTAEPEQTEKRQLQTTDLSPNPAVFLVWRGPEFANEESVHLELFSEMLGGSETSPLHVELVKNKGTFNAAECFYMRSLSDGLFVLYGILNEGISLEEGEKELMEVLQNAIQGNSINDHKLTTVKNKIKTQLLFEQSNLMSKAQKLCFFENIQQLEKINIEADMYKKPSLTEVLSSAAATFTPNKLSVLYYTPQNA